jgi:hypothetical protein
MKSQEVILKSKTEKRRKAKRLGGGKDQILKKEVSKVL